MQKNRCKILTNFESNNSVRNAPRIHATTVQPLLLLRWDGILYCVGIIRIINGGQRNSGTIHWSSLWISAPHELAPTNWGWMTGWLAPSLLLCRTTFSSLRTVLSQLNGSLFSKSTSSQSWPAPEERVSTGRPASQPVIQQTNQLASKAGQKYHNPSVTQSAKLPLYRASQVTFRVIHPSTSPTRPVRCSCLTCVL